VTGERRPAAALNHGDAVPPGPKGLPILGPLLDLRRDVLATLLEGMQRFGDVVRFAGGLPGRFGVRIYALYHPEDVQRVRTAGDDVYAKDDRSSVELRAYLGNGLLTSVGPVWQRQRRILEPLFTAEQVAAFLPIITNEADRLATGWRDTAERRQPADLHRDTTEVSRRVITRVLFGDDAERILPAIAKHQPYLTERAFKRGIAPFPVPASWPTPGNRKAARARRLFRDAVEEVIARRRSEPAGDLVSLMLQAPDPEGGPRLSDGEVRDQVFLFLLAGTDQPATHMALVLHQLGHHPDVQSAIQQEVDAVVAGRDLTVADVGGLVRTAAAITESMRLFPSAYALPRSVEKDEYFRGYRIPAGSQAVTVPWATHRHPDFWDDPERFDPDRFSAETERGRHPFAYFAFGGGPHGCLGAHLAMLDMVVVTATVLRRFRIVTEPVKVPITPRINLRPATAMPARVIPR
jgi:cytochrome P450